MNQRTVRRRPWAAAFLIVCSVAGPEGARAADPPGLDSRSLSELRVKIDRLLREELTRFWYPAAVDSERGGFHENFARDWSKRPDDARSAVYQSRMSWTAAAFAKYSPADREAFTGYARHGIAYLDTALRDREQGGFFWQVGPDGRLAAGDSAEKHVYGTAFVLYAASDVYSAVKDPRALAVARDAFEWLEAHAHDAKQGGYFEALSRSGTPLTGSTAPAGRPTGVDRLGIEHGYKTMNSHIHLLEAVSAYYRVEPSALVKSRLAELLAVVRDRIAVDPGALNLYLTPDWRATPSHDSFGHDVETAYLLLEAAETLGIPDDPATHRMARLLVDHALRRGWDSQHGGFYDKGDALGADAYDTTKVWWTQAEGLNALLLLHEKYRKETDQYGRAFLRQWAFIEGHLIDKQYGGWYMETTREGRLRGDGQKASRWKANYHTSRALVNVATRLGALAKADR